MGYFPSVAFWNWRQPSTDWFNLATGEALAEYNPSPAMRELVAGIESQEKVMKHSRGEYVPLPERFNLPTGEAEVKKRRPRMRADSHLSESAGEIVHITMARDDRDVPLLLHNPLKGLPYPSEDNNPRRPILADEGYEKMLFVAREVHRLCEPFFILVHETGHRAASVRQLRWSDIDLEKKVVRWRAENDKIGFLHSTPLSNRAAEALERLQKAEGAIGEHWVFPSDAEPARPLPRHTANKWWRRAEAKAKLDHMPGMGFHSARRKFASELKGTNLRDLAYMGGWKNPQTVLMVYQQPDMEVQREALAARKKLRATR